MRLRGSTHKLSVNHNPVSFRILDLDYMKTDKYFIELLTICITLDFDETGGSRPTNTRLSEDTPVASVVPP